MRLPDYSECVTRHNFVPFSIPHSTGTSISVYHDACVENDFIGDTYIVLHK